MNSVRKASFLKFALASAKRKKDPCGLSVLQSQERLEEQLMEFVTKSRKDNKSVTRSVMFVKLREINPNFKGGTKAKGWFHRCFNWFAPVSSPLCASGACAPSRRCTCGRQGAGSIRKIRYSDGKCARVLRRGMASCTCHITVVLSNICVQPRRPSRAPDA